MGLEFQGRGIVAGTARGPALVTAQALNLTASFTKPQNLLQRYHGVIQDRMHEWYRQDVAGKVLIFPECIGSTYTGMVFLELVRRGRGPVAVAVENADSLLAAGAILAEVWLERKVPLVEVAGADLCRALRTGQTVEVDGGSGRVRVV